MKLTVVYIIKDLPRIMKEFDVCFTSEVVMHVMELNVKREPTMEEMHKALSKYDLNFKNILLACNGKIVFNEEYKVYSNGRSWITREEFINKLK